MGFLESEQGIAVTAGLVGITIIPATVVWVLSLRTVSRHSQAVKIANTMFHIALPVFLIGLVLYTAYASVAASRTISSIRTYYVLSLMAGLFQIGASILITTSIYIAALAALYVALGRQKWWSWLRLDSLLGTGLLFVLLIAYWAKNLSDVLRTGGRSSYRWRLEWLLIVIDVTIFLLSLTVVGIAISAFSKLKKRGDQLPIGKMPVLLLISSLLWAFRCTYSLAISIKHVTDDWEYDEAVAQRILFPLFDPWVSTAVLALLYLILHSPVWSDPAAIPADGTHAPTQPYQPQPGYPQVAYQQPYQPGYAPPQYPAGYQQQPQQYPNGYQQPQQQQYPQGNQQPQPQQFVGGYQQPQQQQFAGGYQQPQQFTPSPVQSPAPSLPVYAHEVEANQQPHVTVVK